MTRSRIGSALSLVLALALALGACRAGGSPLGAPCARASECESRFCMARASASGDGGAVVKTCVATCTSGAGCAAGEVCGRFAFRETILADAGELAYEAGVPLESDPEVVRVCRPRLTQPCGPGLAACPAGERCLGEPQGVCARVCDGPLECPTRRCLRTRCGEPGLCAPRCDEAPECPRQFYCDLTAFDFSRSGRCAPFDEAEAGFSTCAPPEAGVGADASTAGDGG